MERPLHRKSYLQKPGLIKAKTFTKAVAHWPITEKLL